VSGVKLLPIAGLVVAGLALAGCSVAQKVVTMDAATAVAMAKAINTPASNARAGCYGAVAAVFGMSPKGLLSLYEQLQEGQEIAQGPCAPIVSGIVITLIQQQPLLAAGIAGGAAAAPLLPAIGLP
jgi:hypothetical protein